jgi:nitroreductase
MRVVVHKSAALAAQTFMLSMKAEGYDTCPMEGFDSVRVKKMLKLPRGAEVNMIIGVGKASPDGVYGPRVRVPNEEVIFEV